MLPWLPHDAHQDHRRTGAAVAEAANLCNLPRFSTNPEVDASYQPYELAGIAFNINHALNPTYDISSYK